ncbi:MAG TPA: hypothetical protein VFJ14_12090, partial [Nocardioidaceae bacterium]|nr:hypothetical protein [Nocardioidaceae bacterium]
MQLPRSGGADAETARRRLEMLASSLGGQQSSDQVPDRPPDPARGPVPERPAGRHAAQPDRPLPWRARLLGHLLDAVPPTMRGRWGITAQHVTVVALVVASALALAAWWVVRARPEPVSAPVTAASVAPPQAVTSSPAPVTEAGVPPVESVAPPGLGSTGVTSSVGLV